MAQAVTSIVRDAQVEAARVPPQSIEAEQSVLGGLLLDNAAWDRIADVARRRPTSTAPTIARIFSHIAQLIEDNKPADVAHRRREPRAERQARRRRRPGLPRRARAQHASAANIRRYAEIVRERSIMRKLAAVGDRDRRSAPTTRSGKDASLLIDEAEAKIFQIAEAARAARQGFHQDRPAAHRDVERIDMLYSRENKNDVIGVPTGFVDLDRMTSGLQPGDLIIVAGRPSMGKTTLVMNMAEHVALGSKKAGRGVQHGDVGAPARDAHDRLGRHARPARAAHRHASRKTTGPSSSTRSAS